MNGHGNEKFRTFHTRHQAVPTGEMEETTTPRKMVTTTERSTSSPTIVHEIGHTLDQTGDPFSHRKSLGHKADPIEEGIADGTADRFVRHAGEYEETLHPSYPGRAEEIAGKPTSARNGTGYGIDYHHWKGDKIGKALYAAGRAHAAMADENSANVPTRDSISRQFGIDRPTWSGPNSENQRAATTAADTMLLGRMYHEHEHVRSALDQLGMSKVGEAAHAVYQSAVAKQQPKPAEEWHQQNLIQPTTNGQWVRQDGNG